MNTLSARALALLMVDWRGSNGPAYLALADRIRLLILDGRIPLGTRLPAERELASQLHLSRTTVSAAYAELRDTGYLESVRGSGSTARMPHDASIDLDYLNSFEPYQLYKVDVFTCGPGDRMGGWEIRAYTYAYVEQQMKRGRAMFASCFVP